MKYRTLGRTGIEVSEVGYGAWGIGGALWKGNDDEVAKTAINLAIDNGLNFIDTALAYGDGHSERLVGKVARSRKEQIYIATKIPPMNQEWPARNSAALRAVFTHDYIVKCTETSLRNLGVDCIDLQQLHVWNDNWTNDSEWSDALSKLREEGKVKYFGISINDYQPTNVLKALRQGHIDVVQVIHNIFEQAPELQLFPVCKELNIGVISRVPFDEGGLTGFVTADTKFEAGDWRNLFFSTYRNTNAFEKVQELKSLLGKEAETLPELALRYILSSDAVSTVIPGMRNPKNVLANISYSDGRKLSQDTLNDLKSFAWNRAGVII